jgi:hypothetical protein
MNNYSVFTGEIKMYKKFSLVSLLIISVSMYAYEPYGPHTSDKWQIWAYSSAAPSFIGNNAAIIGASGEVIREGNNGWTCQSANPRPYPKKGWKNPHEAMAVCHDDEGMKWMMAYMQGKKPEMERDSFMWMLNGDMGEDNTKAGVLNKEDSTPGEWIESGPHLMLMPKDPATIERFPTDFISGAPYVMFAGTDYAHLMIPTEGYFKYTK